MPKQSHTLHKKMNRGRRHKALSRIEDHLDGIEGMLKDFGRREKPVTKSDNPKLDAVIGRQVQRMLDLREEPHKQYWNAELDSNAGLGAQYIMMMHFLGRIDFEKQRLYASYTRQWQTEQGFWTIHEGGPGHLSYTVTCYFALKLAGDDTNAPHMKTAREWILANGGAMQIGVEARLQFAMFGLYDWAGVPPIPPWLMLLPHLPMLPKILEQKAISIYDLSYWCRISLIPMSVIYDKKPVRKVGVDIEELFIEAPDERVWDFKTYSEPGIISWGMLIQLGTRSVKRLENLISPLVRKIALRKAKDWILSHQDDSGDWGGIYPPVMYSIIALELLGLDPEDDRIKRAWQALDRFSIYHKEEDGLHMQACVSPVWDTAWSVFALAEAGVDIGNNEMQVHVDWLYSQQILREGDWSVKNPKAVPGAWCFQFHNDFYPDIDDTAIVLMALLWGGGFSNVKCMRSEQVRLGFEWLMAMQNRDGGWSAFESGVDKDIVNHIPFNDIDNMLDPSTADLTGHVLEMLGAFGFDKSFPPAASGIEFCKQTQEPTGAWWGRWGVNYIYGTHGVLCGLAAVGVDMSQPWIRKAVDWLYSVQKEDGSWGEDCESYNDDKYYGKGESTPSQTAWAILALMAAGEVKDARVAKGIKWFISTENQGGGWDEAKFTGTGFPNAFYLNYHYYREYFPLMCLARYRNLIGDAGDSPA